MFKPIKIVVCAGVTLFSITCSAEALAAERRDAPAPVSVDQLTLPEPVVAEGRWRGRIARAPRGTNGFGYDPLFVVAGRDLTAAELGAEEKNRISHRGQALERLLALLRERSR